MDSGRSETQHILIAGGGTGGHVFPALAIKSALSVNLPDAHFAFVGTRRGFEWNILREQGEKLHTLWITGFRRDSRIQNTAVMLKLIISLFQSLWILFLERPALVIGTGGYVMGPILFAAQKLGIPTMLQEQNSMPGLTTRKLAPRARAVCIGLESARVRLNCKRIEHTGNPVRQAFLDAPRPSDANRYQLDPTRKTILVTGGSQGARSINNAISESLRALTTNYNLIWQTGKSGIPDTVNRDLIAAATDRNQLLVLPFIDDMPSAYAASDIGICRAGAMTIAELAVCGLPAIFVPFPFATDDHQTANAASIVEAGGAMMIRDSELNSEKLLKVISECFESSDKLDAMKSAMKSLAHPDAADRIASIAVEILAA